jgi:hypothetical protein
MTLSYTRRNQELQLETRQLQLYTSILHAGGKDMAESFIDVIYNQEWEDFDDFMRKYGPVSNPEAYLHCISLCNYLQELGVLRHAGGNVIRVWEKMEPIIKEFRIRANDPLHWISFENFYNEVKKIQEEQLRELKT